MTRETVILLHGIWMPAVEMAFVRHRLHARHNLECVLFNYPSVSNTLDENALSLAALVKAFGSPPVSLLGHSLGGIVALRMLALSPGLVVKRVVCLGSPISGSRAARSVSRFGWGRSILGRSLPQATVGAMAADWAESVVAHNDVGMIAGSKGVGLGRLVARFEEPNDGTVAVSETRLAGLRDHLVMPVSHTGMVFSTGVADQAGSFLNRGVFVRRDDGDTGSD